jgi:hypothetical protein
MYVCAACCAAADLVFQVVHAMWRRLERATSAAAAAGGSTRPGGPAAAAQERFWRAVARQPAALAFFAKYYRQQVGSCSAAGRRDPIPQAVNLIVAAGCLAYMLCDGATAGRTEAPPVLVVS